MSLKVLQEVLRGQVRGNEPDSRHFVFAYKLMSFKEAQNGTMELKDENLEAVDSMINYFYSFNYESHLYEGAFSDLLELHASVYAVADKYDVPDLKQLAARKFSRDAAVVLIEKRTPFGGFHEAYTSTPTTDRVLRDMVVEFWAAGGATLIKQQGREAVEKFLRDTPDFAHDLAMKYSERPDTPFRGECKCGRNFVHIGRSIFQSRNCDKCSRPVDWKNILGLSVPYSHN